jgi:hypothetical protein
MKRTLPALLLLTACGAQAPTCDDAAACAATCPPPPPAMQMGVIPSQVPGEGNIPVVLDAREWEVFGAEIQAMRAGARPAFENAIGVTGGNDASIRLGPSPGLLPKGTWRIRADFALPPIPSASYATTFLATCKVDTGAANDHAEKVEQVAKTFQLRWESPSTPVSLDGLLPVTSPDPVGHRRCAWKLEVQNPRELTVWEGRFEVPSIDEDRAAGRAGAAAPTGDAPPAAPAEGAPATPEGAPASPPAPPAPPTPPAPAPQPTPG